MYLSDEEFIPEFIVPGPGLTVDDSGNIKDTPTLDHMSPSDKITDGNSASSDWSQIMEDYFDYLDYYGRLEMGFNSSEADKSRQFNKEQSEAEMAFNSAEADKQRAWQENMSNTSYQRTVADMRKAGLNPMLLAAKSSGAVTPSGSTASANSARSTGNASISGLSNYLPNLLKSIGSMYNSVAGTLSWSLDQLGLGNSAHKNSVQKWK